ncbi:MAG: TadE family protein [bacterium]
MNTRSGQAIVELVVALVVIMVLVAGIIQICSMGVSHSKLMTSARWEAGQKAMLDASSFAAPKYIAECTAGNDGIAYSRDDDTTPGDVNIFQGGIVRYAKPDELNLRREDNPVSSLANSSFPQEMFGLVDGEARTSVPLIPVVRQLLYQSDSVELQGKAWMTWTKGIY